MSSFFRITNRYAGKIWTVASVPSRDIEYTSCNVSSSTPMEDNIVRKSSVWCTGHRMKTNFASFALGTFLGLAVAVVPSRAQFVYVTSDFPNNVSAYSIASNGALTPVPGSPFAAGGFASSVAVDPTGKFAYVANSGTNTVSAYSIGSNGALTPVPGSPFAAGIEPISITVTRTVLK